MIAAIALRYAGPTAVLAARPAGVLHVYTGPLTPSGRFIPRVARTVCRARTRRLTVTTDASSLLRRVCIRCATSLRAAKPRDRQLATRAGYKTRFHGLTGHQLVAALADAHTPIDVTEAAHLTLLLFDHTGCRRPDPQTGQSLHDHVADARRRFQTTSAMARLDEHREAASHRRRADQQAAREERDNRIHRIGFRNAQEGRRSS